MAGAEKFCLRWNDFEANISSAFRELREDKDFFDVTLACDDDQIQAHKVILSACSPFFRTVLRRNRHEHPLLYLKGVKYVDLVAVLNFMYHGEVNVAQEELNSFLAVAEDLKVKGLTQNNQDKGGSHPTARGSEPPRPKLRDPSERIDSAPPPKRPRPTPQQFSTPRVAGFNDDDDIQEVVPVKSEPVQEPLSNNPVVEPVVEAEPDYVDHGVVADPNMDNSGMYGAEEYGDYGNYEDNDGSLLAGSGSADGNKAVFEKIKNYMENSFDAEGKRVVVCKFCGFQSRYATNVRSHVEGKHTAGLVYSCLYCSYQVNTHQTYLSHVKRTHPEQIVENY